MKKQPKVTAVFDVQREDSKDTRRTVEIPITKCAQINLTGDKAFFFLEKKEGREGFTFNYTPNIIPEGYRLVGLTFKREEDENK